MQLSSCTVKFGNEPFIAAASQHRLVRHRLKTESLAEIGVLAEVLDERGLVVPAVAFFQEEYANQPLHMVGRRACVVVVRSIFGSSSGAERARLTETGRLSLCRYGFPHRVTKVFEAIRDDTLDERREANTVT